MSTYHPHDWLTACSRQSLGDFTLTREIDAELTAMAALARTDPDARDRLFELLAFKISRFTARFRRWNLGPWDFDDVRQEAYLAFVEVVNGWRPIPGGAPAGFGYYFMRVYPLRLLDRVQRFVQTSRDTPSLLRWDERIDTRHDPASMERDVETLAFIVEMSARLTPDDARILLMRATTDQPITATIAESGLSRSTFYRRWRGIAATIRREAG